MTLADYKSKFLHSTPKSPVKKKPKSEQVVMLDFYILIEQRKVNFMVILRFSNGVKRHGKIGNQVCSSSSARLPSLL